MTSTAEIHERLAVKGLLPADHFKKGKNVVPWTGRSCRKFRNNVFRLQLHALAQNLANLLGALALALPKEVEHGSLTTLREKWVKTGAKVVDHGRCATFRMAEVAVRRELFEKILKQIDGWQRPSLAAN